MATIRKRSVKSVKDEMIKKSREAILANRIVQWGITNYSGDVFARNSDEIEFADCGDQLVLI